MLMNFLAKQAILSFIPKAVDALFAAIAGDKEEESLKKRMPRDSTKITQSDFDLINKKYREVQLHNVGVKRNSSEYITQEELTKTLNIILNKHKVRSVYARVWNGKINRDDLPEE